MKIRMMTAFFVAAGLVANAQSGTITFVPNALVSKHLKWVNEFMSSQGAASNIVAKPTDVQQRLMAQAFPLNSVNDVDSFVYRYSGNRTSAFNYDNFSLKFSSDFADQNVAIYVSPAYRFKSVKADSITHFYQGQRQSVAVAKYNSNDQIDSFKLFAGNGTSRTYNIYTTQGNLTSVLNLDVSGNPVNNLTYFYNSSESAIVSDSFAYNNGIQYGNHYGSRYIYNAQNRLDSVIEMVSVGSGFQVAEIMTFGYNANGKVQNIADLVYTAGNLTQIYRDSFAYQSNLNFSTFHDLQTIDIANNDTFFNRTVKYIGTNNLPDSIMSYYNAGAGLVHYATVKFDYNEYNNPTKVTFTNPNTSGEYRFYYELFDNDTTTAPTAIQNISGKNGLKISPNPIANDIHIHWDGNAVGIVSVNIYNSLGKNVFNTNINLMTGDNKLSVGKMEAGIYILKIKDKNGNIFTGKLSGL